MKVLILVGRFLIEDDDSQHQVSIPFDKCTPEEDAALRALASAQRLPRNVKRSRKQSRSRAGSQPSKRVNYAELVVGRDAAGVNENKLTR